MFQKSYQLMTAMLLAMILLSPHTEAGTEGKSRRQARSYESERPHPSGEARDVVVFARDKWIWCIDEDGKRPERCIQGILPVISPDAEKIAFCTRREHQDSGWEKAELCIYDMSSRTQRAILRFRGVVSHPCWSPDGKRLAFTVLDGDGKSHVRMVRSDGTGEKDISLNNEREMGCVWGLSWTPETGTLVFQDMRHLYRITTQGVILEKTPIQNITGYPVKTVRSSDRFVVCPSDPSLFVFTQAVSGTPFFQKIIDESNTALFIHDRWSGRGKNFRLTPDDITAFDPVWSPDGSRIYFTGYRDKQASEEYPFRVFRIDRDGTGLKELASGENPSVAAAIVSVHTPPDNITRPSAQ